MKRPALVVLGFVAITLVLAWSWEEAGLRISYARFLKTTGRPILDLVGLEDVRIVGGRLRYINWIPFVGLMLVTPGLTVRRRGAGPAIGLVALYASHLLINVTQRGGAPQIPLVPSLVSDTLPFLLWLAAAHPVVRTWFASAVASTGGPEPEVSGEDGPTTMRSAGAATGRVVVEPGDEPGDRGDRP